MKPFPVGRRRRALRRHIIWNSKSTYTQPVIERFLILRAFSIVNRERWTLPAPPPDRRFPMTTWAQSIKNAIHSAKNRPHMPYAKYVQLATVRVDARGPANRTVVFRGFDAPVDAHPPPRLTFVTDRRSGKIADIAANPMGEIAWYFPGSREQFRCVPPVLSLCHSCHTLRQ